MTDTLKRRIGLPLLTAYGVGVMVGAGIYVLTGAAAGAAGMWAPLAFLLAGLVAVPTALTFSELSARVPEAAGDSSYIEVGLNLHWLAVAVGAVNIIAGTVAAAAVLRGGVGYLLSIVDIPFTLAVVGIGVGLTLIAFIGVLESLAFAALMTVIEVVGLCLVVWAGFSAPPVTDWSMPLPQIEWTGLIAATIFGFFAFIGFDDMVNIAEETREPQRAMPRAILLALAITAVLYVLVSLAAVRAVPREVLATSEQPLALVWQIGTGTSGAFLAAIAVAAALNGVLAQIVMASRVFFGLAKRSPVLRPFRHTAKRFGTPILGTLLVGGCVILSSLTLPVATLAEITTQALLIVFTVVNIALIGLKRKEPETPFRVPDYVPWLGAIASLGTLAASVIGGLV
ncbi:APC family permease [Aestuariivita boseongensis]|uniref:APC family permease n=1 Tax=Aestuariivita boseongensis TaxID=1470562 RepID=UPI0006821527|nr:APC family permease [Aestuariivita boseongensis]